MSNSPTDPLQRVAFLNQSLENEGFESTDALVKAFRHEKALLAELPAVFEAALETILERMESTAMFSEETCSFSQNDMLIALSIWLEKTKSYLEKQLGIVN